MQVVLSINDASSVSEIDVDIFFSVEFRLIMLDIQKSDYFFVYSFLSLFIFFLLIFYKKPFSSSSPSHLSAPLFPLHPSNFLTLCFYKMRKNNVSFNQIFILFSLDWKSFTFTLVELQWIPIKKMLKKHILILFKNISHSHKILTIKIYSH